MAEPTTPATPLAGDPVTPPAPGEPLITPATPQAGGAKTPDDYERIVAELRRENAGHRTKLKSFEEAEAARLAAQMSELEQAQKQATDLTAEKEQLAAELYEARVYQEVGKLAGKFNFVISAETLAKMLLLDDDAIEFEDGKPANVEKLLDKLAKREPDLVKQQQAQPGTPQSTRPGAPAVPAMNPGRSSIASPGQAQPGRIPRLDDIQWSR